VPQATNGASCAELLKKWGVDWTRTFSENKVDFIELNNDFAGNKPADLALLVYPTIWNLKFQTNSYSVGGVVNAMPCYDFRIKERHFLRERVL